jgi:hypothetical protein
MVFRSCFLGVRIWRAYSTETKMTSLQLFSTKIIYIKDCNFLRMREYSERLKKIDNPMKRRLLLVGILTSKLEKENCVPILVGGNALEIYSLGGYSTADIDLICDRRKAGVVLNKLGFKEEGRFWVNEDLELIVEFPDISLAGNRDMIESFDIDEFTVYVIGKEDLIVDRLNACIFWKSTEDCRWVKELILLYYGEIDWDYLFKKCDEEGTREELDEIKKEVEEFLNESG